MRLRIAVAGLMVVVLAVAAWSALRPREPVYQGKKLSEWTKYLGTEGFPESPTWEERLLAEEAIWTVGSNAIPFLTAAISKHRPAWIEAYRRKLSKVRVLNLSGLLPLDRRADAAEAFQVIGSQAKPWLPQLEKIATNSSPEVARYAFWAISGIRCEEASAILARAMASSNINTQVSAINGLGSLGWQGRKGVSELVKASRSTNYLIRMTSALAMAEILDSPSEVIPELMARLHETNSSVKFATVRALAPFGTAAAEAGPIVNELISSSEPRIARIAKQTLPRLEREVRDGAVVRGPFGNAKLRWPSRGTNLPKVGAISSMHLSVMDRKRPSS